MDEAMRAVLEAGAPPTVIRKTEEQLEEESRRRKQQSNPTAEREEWKYVYDVLTTLPLPERSAVRAAASRYWDWAIENAAWLQSEEELRDKLLHIRLAASDSTDDQRLVMAKCRNASNTVWKSAKQLGNSTFEDWLWKTVEVLNSALARYEQSKGQPSHAYRCWVGKLYSDVSGQVGFRSRLWCADGLNLTQDITRPEPFMNYAKGVVSPKGRRIYHVGLDAYRSMQMLEKRVTAPNLSTKGASDQVVETAVARTLASFEHEAWFTAYDEAMGKLFSQSAMRAHFQAARTAYAHPTGVMEIFFGAYQCRKTFPFWNAKMALDRLLYLATTRGRQRTELTVSASLPPEAQSVEDKDLALELTKLSLLPLFHEWLRSVMGDQAPDPLPSYDEIFRVFIDRGGAGNVATQDARELQEKMVVGWRANDNLENWILEWLEHPPTSFPVLNQDDVACQPDDKSLYWKEIGWPKDNKGRSMVYGLHATSDSVP